MLMNNENLVCLHNRILLKLIMKFAGQCLVQPSSEKLLLEVDGNKHRDPQPDKLDFEALSPRLSILSPKQ